MTNEPFQIRKARVSDAVSIVSLIRSGFDRDLLSATIYGADGIESFIREQVAISEDCETVFAVADCDGAVVGCAEFRRLVHDLCLNYIAVSPGFREAGMASRLFSFGLQEFRLCPEVTMILDVLEHNSVAKGWYERLGFKRESSKQMWEARVCVEGSTPGRFVISNYAQAQALQRLYGFSELAIQSVLGDYRVGRMGNNYYRVQPSLLQVPGLMLFLNRLDPARRLLYTTSGDSSTVLPGNARLIATLIRMSIPLDRLLDKDQRRQR